MTRSAPRGVPDAKPQSLDPKPSHSRSPRPEDPPAVTVPELDDDIPGALRERMPTDPAVIAAIVARPETQGPKGVFPWTFNPDDPFPSLAAGPLSRRADGPFSRRR